MYFIYVDESGDVGLNASPSNYFILSGIVVHELSWHDTLEKIIDFRQQMKSKYKLKLREEIHAGAFFQRSGGYGHILKSHRLRIIRDALDFQATLAGFNIINIVVSKSGKSASYDVFNNAWQALTQRFENTLNRRNFPGPANAQDKGMLIVDRTDEKKLRMLSRRMRKYNPVPDRGGSGFRTLPIKSVVEDPVHRDSIHSYFIQLADVNSYSLLQKLKPNAYFKKKSARNYFDRLDPVLCKVASTTNPQGIVML
jgi:hypothetical protein